MVLSTSGNNSGVWEVVGKPQKKTNTASRSSAASKPVLPKGPKLEDVLPAKQVASWYSNVYDLPYEEQKKTSSPQPKKETKPQAKKSAEQQQQPKKQVEKKPPNIETAVANVSSNELKDLLATAKSLYPENQILWLRDVGSYLNTVLATSERSPDWTNNPFSSKPLSLLTKETRKAIIQTLEECSESTRQMAFGTFLANVAHDMAKGQSVNGYLILLQLLSDVYPSICLTNFERYSELRNSYLNRPNVGTALLWALGQGGRKDMSVGLKVWLEFMVPFLHLRHYSKFVVNYLTDLLSTHTKLTKRRVIYPTQFLQFFEVFFVTSNTGLNKDLQIQLMKQYPLIKALCEGDGSQDYELFSSLLRRLSTREDLMSDDERSEAIAISAQCLVHCTDASLALWQQMYTSHVKSSTQILKHIVHRRESAFVSILGRSKMFVATVTAFQEYNLGGAPRHKDGINDAVHVCNVLLSKTSCSNSKVWFPWKLSCILLLSAVVYTISKDTERHGSFKGSNTGKFLHDVGMLDRTLQIYQFSHDSYTHGRLWIGKNYPMYMKSANIYLQPVLEWSDKAWGKTQKAFQHMSIVANSYLPGAQERLEYLYETGISYAHSSYIWTSTQSRIYGKILQGYSANAFKEFQAVATGETVTNAKVAAHDFFEVIKKYIEVSYKWVADQ